MPAERGKSLGTRLLRNLPRMGAIAVLSTAVAAGLWSAGAGGLASVERALYDSALSRFTAQRRGQSTRIVVVTVDQPSLEGVRDAGPYPWSPALWAQVVRELSQQGARAVLFDGILDKAPATEDDELAFAQAVRDTRLPVYLGIALHPSAAPLPQVEPVHVPRAPGAPPPEAARDDADPAWTARRLAFPVRLEGHTAPVLAFEPTPGLRFPHHVVPLASALLAEADGVGLVERERDSDGVLRRTRFFATDGLNTYVTLPVALAADLFGATELSLSGRTLRLGSHAFTVNEDGSAELDFRSTLHQRFPLLPVLSVLEASASRRQGQPGGLDPELLRDKVVLVSVLAPGEGDYQLTPFATGTPGVIQQATVLENLLEGRFVTETPFWMSLALALALALLSTGVLMTLRSPVVEVFWIVGLVPVLYLGVGTCLSVGRVHPLIALPALAGLLASLGALASNHLFARREAVFIRRAFSRYMEPRLIEQMIDQEQLPRLDGEEREISAFFSDVRGFSTFSERFRDNPRALVRVLNQYLTRVSSALLREGGCLDKYIGDAVVCLFGAPAGHTDHALRACRGALAAQAEVERLREEFRAQGLPDVYTRIGINTAKLFVGNFGSEQLFDYTAMGDGMNLASRLEGANKAYGTLILIGPRTYELAREHIEVRELDRVRVAGKTEAVQVFELLALKGGLSPEQRETVERYHEALALYRRAAFGPAAALLEAQLKRAPKDGPTAALLGRCYAYLQQPPAADWDGVVSLEK